MKKISLVAAALATVCLSVPAVLVPDGPVGTVLQVFVGNDAEYAKGYNYWDFVRVRRGMPVEELVALLGEPRLVSTEQPEFRRYISRSFMRLEPGQACRFEYSTSSHGRSFSSRVVEVVDGRVVGKTTGFLLLSPKSW